MDYKKKYLKYKLKYLQAKQTFKGGIEQKHKKKKFGGEGSGEMMTIQVDTLWERKTISVSPCDKIYTKVADAFFPHYKVVQVLLWSGNPMGADDTFEKWDQFVKDGAVLQAVFGKFTVEELIAQIVELNDGLRHLRQKEAERLRNVSVDTDDPSLVKGNVDWYDLGIKVLPESFGDLIIEGYLDLSGNKLASLPESFGCLTVKGNLYLNKNELASLPASFGNLTLNGKLRLDDNNLDTLPASFAPLNRDDKVSLKGNPVAASKPRFDGLNIVY